MNRRRFSKALAGVALGTLASSIPEAIHAQESKETPFPLSVMLCVNRGYREFSKKGR